MDSTTPPNALPEFLRQYRHTHGLTVQELAMRCQIPMATLMGLEYGDRPQEEDLEALARGLELPLPMVRRASLGEAMPVPESPYPAAFEGDGETEDALELPRPDDRATTLLEAIQGLSPSQIEKTKDFIRFLRWSDQQDARD